MYVRGFSWSFRLFSLGATVGGSGGEFQVSPLWVWGMYGLFLMDLKIVCVRESL